MLRYKGGVETGHCHKVPLRDGRDILVCVSGWEHTGAEWVGLYFIDLLHDEKPGAIFSAWSDRYGSCDAPSLYLSTIDKVEFLAEKRNDLPVISVTASLGEKQRSHEDIEACKRDPDSMALPPSKTYRMEFVFNGHGYEPTPSSAAIVRLFGPAIQ